MSIKDRAIEWAKSVSPWTTIYDISRMNDYIKGAQDQREADLKCIEQWLEYVVLSNKSGKWKKEYMDSLKRHLGE